MKKIQVFSVGTVRDMKKLERFKWGIDVIYINTYKHTHTNGINICVYI